MPRKKKEVVKEAPKPDFSINVTGEQAAALLAAAPVQKKEPTKEEWPPLAPGQKYFIDPKTDEHIIGDADKDTVLYRPKDGRKPFHINPKR